MLKDPFVSMLGWHILFSYSNTSYNIYVCSARIDINAKYTRPCVICDVQSCYSFVNRVLSILRLLQSWRSL